MLTSSTVLPATLTSTGTMSTGEIILFVVVAVVTVCCGLGLLTARRAVTAAVNMIAIMISLAILYLANEAPFLGITQVVVYTGAVMTLVLFVVMLVGVGGDEPVGSCGSPFIKWIIGLFGLGLIELLACIVLRTQFSSAVGLADGATAAPSDLAMVLFGEHVVAMELTGLLLIVAATGALTLTHRQRIRAKVTQRSTVDAKMRAYREHGTHPGQKPMSGVYAATNTAAAPALSASGDVVADSVPRVLRARGQGLDLTDVSPEYAAALRAGTVEDRRRAVVDRSAMPSMPGAPAPVVAQPLATDRVLDAGAQDHGAIADKEEEK